MNSIIQNIKKLTIFDLGLRVLLLLLPFTTIISVFSKERLWVPIIGFYKEFILLLMFMIVVIRVIQKQIHIKWWYIDWSILLYIWIMVLISIPTTWIAGIIYGGRYDFAFLLAFWIIYHGSPFLHEKVSYYLQLFLISWGIMLFLSGLLKWPLSEDILLWFGYCGNPSNWQACNGVPPIFHGIDWANVRRFQWLLDGPNTMGAFLILFGGIFAYYMRMKKDWYFVTGLICLGIFGMIVYTYSRSALIGALSGSMVAIMWWMSFIYRKYKKQFIISIAIACVLLWILSIKYASNAWAILGRAWSTKWHYERMITSIQRFQSHPMWQWLASSGPAYRYIVPIDAKNMEEKDRFYIPESWYIQQFVEGWIFGGLIFLGIMLLFFIKLISRHPILGGMFVGIWVMNLFLHTFESSVLSLSLFILIAIILSDQDKNHQNIR